MMRIKKLTTIADFPMPLRATEGSGAFDLHAAIDAPATLRPGDTAEIGTGYAWEIPAAKVGLLLPRSGLGSKGLALMNTCGVVDCDYRGEVVARIRNWHPTNTVTIQPGERFCQLLIVQSYIDELELAEKLSATARGAGGFGHTGS